LPAKAKFVWPALACLLGAAKQTKLRKFIMVVIRLARGGAKKRPFYNIVVADSRERRDGRYLERVGFYNPMASGQEEPLRVVFDRVTYWKGVGAQASPTVQRLLDTAAKKAVGTPLRNGSSSSSLHG
jgi:small subunit ribosomal protein S16